MGKMWMMKKAFIVGDDADGGGSLVDQWW